MDLDLPQTAGLLGGLATIGAGLTGHAINSYFGGSSVSRSIRGRRAADPPIRPEYIRGSSLRSRSRMSRRSYSRAPAGRRVARARSARRRITRVRRLPMTVRAARRQPIHTFEYPVATASIYGNATATVDSINAVPRGVSATERLGNHMHMLRYEMRGAVEMPTTVPDTGRFLFNIAVIYDRQGSQVANPTYGDIFTSIAVNSFQRTDNRHRFVILWRLTGHLTQGVNPVHDIDVSIPVNRGTRWVDGDSTGGSLNTIYGAMFVVTLGQFEDSGALYNISFKYTRRLTFNPV